MKSFSRLDRGFTITELMLTVAIAATLAGVAVPLLGSVSNGLKLNEATRMVERELQDARIKAVSTNTPVRMRTNCPAAGYLRIVEVLGTVALDTAANRCLQTAYPFPADNDLMTRPNADGPVRVLANSATVNTETIQFAPDGTAKQVVDGLATAIAAQVTLTVTRNGESRLVTINGLGKVQLQ
jgi:prepilin-type N-terminal cleavage/methylation domain-containing protein